MKYFSDSDVVHFARDFSLVLKGCFVEAVSVEADANIAGESATAEAADL